MGCSSCNTSNLPNGCKSNGYCLTQRCNQKTTLSSILNAKKNKNQVEIHDKIDRFDNIHI